MAQVLHTVNWYYGSYSGTCAIYCDENDDMEVVKAKVKKQENLNFLSMVSDGYKIVATKHYYE